MERLEVWQPRRRRDLVKRKLPRTKKGATMSQPQKQQGIKITFPEALRGGVYANMMVVAHTKEEFVLDFLLAMPPGGAVTCRVILSPGHMKRVLRALKENVDKYETQFGRIEEAAEPKAQIGF
jgi:hypothetical protein